MYGEAEEPETDDAEAFGEATATGLADEKDDGPPGDAALLEPGCVVVVDEDVGPGDVEGATVSLECPAALADVDDGLEDDAVRFVPFALELLPDFAFDSLRFDSLLRRYLAALLDALSRDE